LGRLRYRVYRHPAVMFGVGPAYLFIVQHRLPVGLMRHGWQPWLSTMATNLAIAVVVATMIWLIGVGPFLPVHLPVMLLAASVGVWLFYVQHQFEHTVWAHDDAWNLQEVALHGSSHYALPGLLRWFTANIGVDHPTLDRIGRLTLLQSFRCVRLVLWDENQQRLVSFRDVRRNYRSA
jgi:omega-6 fatty acid desaturase (delta-12 desaturase)